MTKHTAVTKLITEVTEKSDVLDMLLDSCPEHEIRFARLGDSYVVMLGMDDGVSWGVLDHESAVAFATDMLVETGVIKPGDEEGFKQ